MLKCIAIDDEPPALELLKNYASRVPGLQMLQTFDDAISASEFLRGNTIDILFIDINMPDINGIDLVRSLQQRPLIIFTTAYKKFAYDGFELEAIDYLLKPIEFERFNKAVKKAMDAKNNSSLVDQQGNKSILVRSEYKMIPIELADIEFIEGLEDYVKIYIQDARPILTLSTLKTFIEKLPKNSFQRIHRSYIIPLARVVSISNKKILLNTGKELPVSETYSSFITEWMNRR